MRFVIRNDISSFRNVIVEDDKSGFYPSNGGGVSVITKGGRIFHPWTEGVVIQQLYKKNLGPNTKCGWIMYKENDFQYTYEVVYTVYFSELIIKFADLEMYINNDSIPKEKAEIYGVLLDRCENAINPVIIGVPYLTTFNILYANKCFVSMYFDWNRSNASQILPYNSVYSNSSVYYSQYALYNKKTNGKRNKLDETIIMKVSDNIDDVLPDIPNPRSVYYKESAQRIVFDDWKPFDRSMEQLTKIENSGIRNIWHILHNWQNQGYDVALPDVFPANSNFGGNVELLKISQFNKSNGNLFSLHENYIDIFKLSSQFKRSNLSFNSHGEYLFNWLNPNNLDSSFIVKPSKVISILSPISTLLHKEFETTAAYHDVSSSYDPSKFVDYEHSLKDAGKFCQPYNSNIAIADTLRKIHSGPVSGEGLAHFLYSGYYDDFCAQLHTAKSLPGAFYGQSEKLGGFYKPLFVNFDLLKMKEKTFVHGMGYYSRFFYNSENNWGSIGYSRDSALMYAATELAYGHGAFCSSDSYNFIEQCEIEYKYVYPMQIRYADSKVKLILYNDTGKLISASDYIKKYPATFDNFFSPDFMGQLYVQYENGVEVFVNRHPSRTWNIGSFNKNGFYSHNAVYNNVLKLYSGHSTGGKFELPASNGWVCYSAK
ncbi:MAG: hypothetical protein IAE93_04305 [Ignavibacteria bacterium]|nr:hypothetical protein [Ignavibacteria bacterium]